jgi:hypothetical protein
MEDFRDYNEVKNLANNDGNVDDRASWNNML